jgi:toxin ParE1/3/4
MAGYRLTRQAAADLNDIYLYTFETFGEIQAERYVEDMYGCIALIAENPRLGRMASFIRPGIFHFTHRSHSIYYKPESDGVLIVRVLHDRMDPTGRI